MPLVRVRTGRLDDVRGVTVHPERLRLFVPYEPRFTYDPTPAATFPFTLQEDGAFPGNLSLTEKQIEELLGGAVGWITASRVASVWAWRKIGGLLGVPGQSALALSFYWMCLL